MEFSFSTAVAEPLQVAQGPRCYGDFLRYLYVESKVVVDGEAKDFVSTTDRDGDRVRQSLI